MASTARDQRIVIVNVSKAELITLLGSKARELNLIDFDPDRVQVHEVNADTDEFQIVFEKDNV
jgi:hypothetical protein